MGFGRGEHSTHWGKGIIRGTNKFLFNPIVTLYAKNNQSRSNKIVQKTFEGEGGCVQSFSMGEGHFQWQTINSQLIQDNLCQK